MRNSEKLSIMCTGTEGQNGSCWRDASTMKELLDELKAWEEKEDLIKKLQLSWLTSELEKVYQRAVK